MPVVRLDWRIDGREIHTTVRFCEIVRDAPATALSSRYGFDFFDPDALPAILVTLALAADPCSVLLVSSRNPLRITRCAVQINWSIARGDRSDYVDKVGAFLTGDSAGEATVC